MMEATSSLVAQQLVKTGQLFPVTFLIIAATLVLVAYSMGRRGKVVEIRPLEALDAAYEGIGRCAEMGRPVMVLAGCGSLSAADTIAGLTFLGEAAQRAAGIGVDTLTSHSDTNVIAFSEAVIKTAYERAGKADRYAPGEFVRWFGGDQYAYAVGTAGYILAEKPGLLVLLGSFMSDVIVSMETGTRVGAEVIGGCMGCMPEMSVFADYLWIGEEIYAASALISRDPRVIATLVSEDWIKLIFTALTIIGVLLMLAQNSTLLNLARM